MITDYPKPRHDCSGYVALCQWCSDWCVWAVFVVADGIYSSVLLRDAEQAGIEEAADLVYEALDEHVQQCSRRPDFSSPAALEEWLRS